MTVEAYLRSLVPGLDLDDAVVERCARSPKEVWLEPLALDGDIDLFGKVKVEDEEEEEEPADDTEAGAELPTDSGDATVDDDVPPMDGDEEYIFQMRLDYASSCIYYSVLGVFTGGGYSEQVGDVRVSRSGFTITMADRERFKMLGDALRRKYGWDTEEDPSDDSGVFDASYLCNAWNT